MNDNNSSQGASATPEPGQADEKDWTWVLERPCPDCGAEVGGLSTTEIAELNTSCAAAWVNELRTRPDVRERPAPDVWSPLEYGAHVRDVFRLFLVRLDLMLTEENPTFENWNPNVTAEAERYDLQDPAVVANELMEAASAIGQRFEELTPDQLSRVGQRSDGAVFTVESFAQYEIHDPLHHLWDITQ